MDRDGIAGEGVHRQHVELPGSKLVPFSLHGNASITEDNLDSGRGFFSISEIFIRQPDDFRVYFIKTDGVARFSISGYCSCPQSDNSYSQMMIAGGLGPAPGMIKERGPDAAVCAIIRSGPIAFRWILQLEAMIDSPMHESKTPFPRVVLVLFENAQHTEEIASGFAAVKKRPQRLGAEHAAK